MFEMHERSSLFGIEVGPGTRRVVASLISLTLVGSGVVIGETLNVKNSNTTAPTEQMAQPKPEFTFLIDSLNWEKYKDIGWRFVENFQLHGSGQEVEASVEAEVDRIRQKFNTDMVNIGTPTTDGVPQETSQEFNSQLFRDKAHNQVGIFYRPQPAV